ncbi:MAG: vWA domain-containing protein, partial [Polyangiales bacterium]
MPTGTAGNPTGGGAGRANGAAGSGLILPAADGGGVSSDGDGGAVCARQQTEAALEPIYLAFAFDVSGSMGKGDKPWHDRSLKWEPVVRATRGFLEDAASQGLSASMTFFPADGGDDTRCELSSYQQADVTMRGLPSRDFGAALDVIGMEDWRGGTPTLYVLQGIFAQIQAAEQTMPGRYAIVLVTDGYPQDCDDDSIASVATLVREHASTVPTYVIGVANPPLDDAPDVTTNLAEVAAAGGTGDAHLIDTGDPDKTARDFTATIEAIRRATVSC